MPTASTARKPIVDPGPRRGPAPPRPKIVRPITYPTGLGKWSLVLGILSILLSFAGIGIIFGLLGVLLAYMQRKTAKTTASAAGLALGVLGTLFSLASIAYLISIPLPPSPYNTTTSVNNNVTSVATSVETTAATTASSCYCSSNNDCASFGQNTCQGPAYCGSDSLCHCAVSICPGGANCQAVTCSSNDDCGGGSDTTCTNGVCLHSAGGCAS